MAKFSVFVRLDIEEEELTEEKVYLILDTVFPEDDSDHINFVVESIVPTEDSPTTAERRQAMGEILKRFGHDA